MTADPFSFSLYHQVNVDASLEYKFLDPSGVSISSRTLQIGENEVGGLYASFNTNRQISVGLRWEPLLRNGEQVAAEGTIYPYLMTIKNPSGETLPVFADQEAGVLSGNSEFVVYGDYSSGEAYFINKWLHKSSSAGMFDISKICSMTISLAENETLLAGTYSGRIYFIVEGS